ncbi:tripartite tricarboxylate transporter substrate binding protein [Alcaligenaceae bacterium LF4-65]|jgi:tripartite-type tricarboxylate transporter receptor subunit TctC|uniref:Tripartite tricarboxylate transporter substrate binding protein n=1 Tax=Zwartia hollandica TaxID=324606 RepID=A0A953N9G4_9BURK|nr:tripartite tricarboxylate transporter substrate binding protein [Zwartia hollandica]MBZ1349589.1 tripartite tricarboxylate transporter substrate binding protein [Zwartia hollandica]
MTFTLLRKIVAIASLSMFSTLASAQNWPTKPVRIVLQFPPGGSTDVVARILAQSMTTALGQPVVVENKPGADGAIAAEYVMRSDPDGYTFFLASNTPMMQVPLLRKKPPYDPVKNFTPISMVGRYVYVLVANPNVPAKNAKELLEFASKNPGKLNYGSYSGVTQLMHTKLTKEAKIDTNLIPYKGEGPTINDMLGGHVQFTFATPTSTLSHISAEKLRAMAVLLPKRSALLPDVPTAAEAGIPTLEAGTWAALFGPANMPAELATKMSEAINAAMARPDVRDRIAKQGFDLGGSTPKELGSFVQDQLKAWAQAFADAGLKPE